MPGWCPHWREACGPWECAVVCLLAAWLQAVWLLPLRSSYTHSTRECILRVSGMVPQLDVQGTARLRLRSKPVPVLSD